MKSHDLQKRDGKITRRDVDAGRMAVFYDPAAVGAAYHRAGWTLEEEVDLAATIAKEGRYGDSKQQALALRAAAHLRNIRNDAVNAAAASQEEYVYDDDGRLSQVKRVQAYGALARHFGGAECDEESGGEGEAGSDRGEGGKESFAFFAAPRRSDGGDGEGEGAGGVVDGLETAGGDDADDTGGHRADV